MYNNPPAGYRSSAHRLAVSYRRLFGFVVLWSDTSLRDKQTCRDFEFFRFLGVLSLNSHYERWICAKFLNNYNRFLFLSNFFDCSLDVEALCWPFRFARFCYWLHSVVSTRASISSWNSRRRQVPRNTLTIAVHTCTLVLCKTIRGYHF